MAAANSSSNGTGNPRQGEIIAEVEADWARYRESGLAFEAGDDHTEDWNRFFAKGSERLIKENGKIRRKHLVNFWQSGVFIGDNPREDLYGFPSRWRIRARGETEVMERLGRVLRRYDCRPLLKKYPCPTTGNPNVYLDRGIRTTHRWTKHIYHLKRTEEFLRPRLEPGFVALDIGSGHGLFSSLLHQEYAGSHHVLVDLPEQLLLARYFLRTTFPEAKIAGIGELEGFDRIPRELLERYDFVLLPWQFYERMEPGSIHLLTSFASLGEMQARTFRYYVDAPVFRTAKYLYTVNPVRSNEMFSDSRLTLLDYPLSRGEACLYFGISPIFLYSYGPVRKRGMFSYELAPFPAFFEYIGGIDPGEAVAEEACAERRSTEAR